jgi:hypothetical protein
MYTVEAVTRSNNYVNVYSNTDVRNLPNLVRYGIYSLLGYTACNRVGVYCL